MTWTCNFERRRCWSVFYQRAQCRGRLLLTVCGGACLRGECGRTCARTPTSNCARTETISRAMSLYVWPPIIVRVQDNSCGPQEGQTCAPARVLEPRGRWAWTRGAVDLSLLHIRAVSILIVISTIRSGMNSKSFIWRKRA